METAAVVVATGAVVEAVERDYNLDRTWAHFDRIQLLTRSTMAMDRGTSYCRSNCFAASNHPFCLAAGLKTRSRPHLHQKANQSKSPAYSTPADFCSRCCWLLKERGRDLIVLSRAKKLNQDRHNRLSLYLKELIILCCICHMRPNLRFRCRFILLRLFRRSRLAY